MPDELQSPNEPKTETAATGQGQPISGPATPTEPQPGAQNTEPANPTLETASPASPAATATNNPSNPSDLTSDQQKFIHQWSFGPFSSYLYFWAMDAWKVGILFVLVEIIGNFATYFLVSLVAGFIYKALNVFGGTGTPFFILMFGTGAVATIIWMLGLIIWAMRKGRSIAWTHRKWISYDNFVEVQKKWDLAGKIFLILSLLWIGLWVATALPGLLLLSTNPASRIAQAQDAAVRSPVQEVAIASMDCSTANKGFFTNCSSLTKLQSQGFISQSALSKDSNVRVDIAMDGKSVIVYAKVSSNAVCNIGTGAEKYYVYRSETEKYQVECGSMAPMLSGSSMPGMNVGATPMPTKSGNMLY